MGSQHGSWLAGLRVLCAYTVYTRTRARYLCLCVWWRVVLSAVSRVRARVSRVATCRMPRGRPPV